MTDCYINYPTLLFHWFVPEEGDDCLMYMKQSVINIISLHVALAL